MIPSYKESRNNIERCGNGKPCYDKKTAQTARNKAMRLRHQPLRIYPCPDCNWWHLTHVDPYGTDREKKYE